MHEHIKARELLEELVRVTNARNMCDVADFIDNLDEPICKIMLKMIAYGSYKDFIEEEMNLRR